MGKVKICHFTPPYGNNPLIILKAFITVSGITINSSTNPITVILSAFNIKIIKSKNFIFVYLAIVCFSCSFNMLSYSASVIS